MPATTHAMQPKSVPKNVEAFLESFNHPLRPAVLTLRQIILEADPSIQEGIKWNVPSFRTSEFFATMHVRSENRVGLILHFGAKKRDTTGIVINDPESLLEWLAEDRGQVMFQTLDDLDKKRPALDRLIREWIKYVQ